MSNFDQFTNMMRQYLAERGCDVSIESDISTLSKSKGEKLPLCKSIIQAVDMDTFAKKGYRKCVLPHSNTEDDSINTADAFLINNENKWYFVEFKDGMIGNAKASVLKKAYSNVYAVLDMLYAMQKTKDRYEGFDYENPIEFVRNHVTYILVFSSAKNPNHVKQLKNHQLKGEHYLPPFMERLPGYIYEDAYAVTEVVFDGAFTKNFCC